MKIPIRSIEIDSDNYPRAEVNDLRVAEYSDRMLAGDKFPETVVYDDGQRRHLSDGRHRILAAQINGETEIEADVRHGTKADALWFGLGANRAHGSRMTPGDLQHAIRLALREFPNRSAQTIADRIGCSRTYVAKLRTEMEDERESSQVDTSVNLLDRMARQNNANMTEPHDATQVAANGDGPERRVEESKAEVEVQRGSVQVVTSGNLPDRVIGKDGKKYAARRARGTGQAAAKTKRLTGRSTLAQLKRYWKIATREDRTAFMNWIHAEDQIADYALEVAARPDDSTHGTGADHHAGEDPEAWDDGPHRDHHEQGEAEG